MFSLKCTVKSTGNNGTSVHQYIHMHIKIIGIYILEGKGVFFVFFSFLNLVKSFPLSQIEPISDACLCDVTQTGRSHDSLIDSSVSAQTGFMSNLTHPE